MSETDRSTPPTPPPAPAAPAAPGSTSDGVLDRPARLLTIGGFVSGGLALLVLPIILGPLGILLGFLGNQKGDPKGKVAMYVSIATTIIGIVMGLLVLNSSGAV